MKLKIMRLGVYIHGSSPFRPKESIQEYYDLALKFEKLGCDTLWFADHLIRTPDPNRAPLYETWALISAIAARTSKIRLGTMVTPITFRNLGYFAKMITTIDHISEGRVIAGLGTGWYEKEHTIFNIPLPPLKERFKLLEETLVLLKQLWMDESVTSPSDFTIKLKDAYINPKPKARPHPPILIGGSGEKKTLKFVARYAQMANFGGTEETIRQKIEVLKNHCNIENRDFGDILVTTNRAIVMGEDEQEVEIGIQNYCARFTELGMNPPDRSSFRANRLVGTPSQVKSQLQNLEDLGVGMVNLTINDSRTEELLSDLF